MSEPRSAQSERPAYGRLKQSHKFPDKWERWVSYDGKTWTMVGLVAK